MHIIHLHGRFVTVWVRIEFLLAISIVAASSRQVVGKSVVVPSLERNAPRVKSLIFNRNNTLVSLLTNDNVRIAPAKVILVPEGIQWQNKIEERETEKVDKHPPNMLPLPFDDEDDGLKAIHTSYDSQRNIRNGTRVLGDPNNQIDQVRASCRKHDSSHEIYKDNKAHTKATEPAQVFQRAKLGEVVNGGIDPSTSL